MAGIAAVLLACGGVAHRPRADAGPIPDAAVETDACVPADEDGDGFDACDGDCDDGDSAVHPGAADRGAGWARTLVSEPASPDAVWLAADAAGALHVAWALPRPDGSAELQYARQEASAFVVEDVTPLSSTRATTGGLAIDAAGNPHVGIADGATLVHAKLEAGAWTVDRSPLAVDFMTAGFAVHADGRAIFAYQAGGGEPLRLREEDGAGGWAEEDVASDSERATPVVAVAPDDTVVVAYFAPLPDALLRVASRSVSGWTVEDAYEWPYGDISPEIGLALDAGGAPRVGLRDGTAVWLTQRVTDGWTTSRVSDVPYSEFDAGGVRVAVGERTFVAFQERLGEDLDVARGEPWEIDFLASLVGRAFAIASGADGAPHVVMGDGARLLHLTPIPDPVGGDPNCDGVPGVDADGDGHASFETGGDDCDDARDDVFSWAPEILGDGIDQDCHGGLE